jgi:hypothetical protein
MPHFMVCDSTDLPVPFFVVKDAHVKNGPPLIFSTNSEKSLSDPEPVGGLLKTKKSSTTREKCATRNLRIFQAKLGDSTEMRSLSSPSLEESYTAFIVSSY